MLLYELDKILCKLGSGLTVKITQESNELFYNFLQDVLTTHSIDSTKDMTKMDEVVLNLSNNNFVCIKRFELTPKE